MTRAILLHLHLHRAGTSCGKEYLSLKVTLSEGYRACYLYLFREEDTRFSSSITSSLSFEFYANFGEFFSLRDVTSFDPC